MKRWISDNFEARYTLAPTSTCSFCMAPMALITCVHPFDYFEEMCSPGTRGILDSQPLRPASRSCRATGCLLSTAQVVRLRTDWDGRSRPWHGRHSPRHSWVGLRRSRGSSPSKIWSEDVYTKSDQFFALINFLYMTWGPIFDNCIHLVVVVISERRYRGIDSAVVLEAHISIHGYANVGDLA
jgi:hypothetical protein